jgi:hypothetical protein
MTRSISLEMSPNDLADVLVRHFKSVSERTSLTSCKELIYLTGVSPENCFKERYLSGLSLAAQESLPPQVFYLAGN